MFSDLLGELMELVAQEQSVLGPVYAGYDGMRAGDKAKPACVLLPGDVKLGSAVPDGGSGIMPFEAHFALVLLDAMDTPGSVLQDRLLDTALPAVRRAGAQLFSAACPLPKADPLLGRLTLRGEFVIRGVYAFGEETEEVTAWH